jgi:hypothetical protein
MINRVLEFIKNKVYDLLFSNESPSSSFVVERGQGIQDDFAICREPITGNLILMISRYEEDIKGQYSIITQYNSYVLSPEVVEALYTGLFKVKHDGEII